MIDKEAKRLYDKARHDRLRALRPPKTWRSKYRWMNNGNGQGIPVHQVIAERALGKALTGDACVHHVDGNGHNNANSNLVICPSQAYHALLHRRQRAFDECGHADWFKCVFCKQYDAPDNLHLYTPKDQTSPRANHSRCSAEYSRRKKGG